MRSKIRRPFQKWRMAYVSRLIETVDNEASRYTVGTESIQTPLNFSLFVILQPFAKII